ncbi:MAG TPA: methyltransferase domain-containing protein [Anaerolineae bacterium]|nr:methyltransferase domain-containing protein [Anaerolineae bacterium]
MKPNFEFDGEKYKAASKHQKEWGSKIISELNLSGDEAILDLGCGDGVLTAQLASLVPHGRVLGIDASEGMIATAKKLESDIVSFQVLDIDGIDFTDEFDLIFSNATLHWIKDHKRLLQHAYEGLKSGGFLRFNFAGDGNCASFEKVTRAAIRDIHYQPYFKDFEWPWYMPAVSNYELLVKESSFTDVRVWLENADRHFSSPKEMIHWIDQPSLVPFLMHIPIEEDKKRFRDTVVNRMKELTLQDDGRCFETFRRINVYARK